MQEIIGIRNHKDKGRGRVNVSM